jgi:hypothetical protein
VRLFQKDSLINGAPLSDGLLIKFDPRFSNSVDQLDAIKPTNQDENMSVNHEGQLLSIESRKTAIEIDTVLLNFTQYRNTNYSLRFEYSIEFGVETFLLDKYFGTTTSIPATGVFYHDFNVNPLEPKSIAKDRFALIFKNVNSSYENISTEKSIVKILPNPSNGAFTIQNSMATDNEVWNVTITNAVGQTIGSFSTSNLKSGASMDLLNLNSGMYYFKGKCQNKEFTLIHLISR